MLVDSRLKAVHDAGPAERVASEYDVGSAAWLIAGRGSRSGGRTGRPRRLTERARGCWMLRRMSTQPVRLPATSVAPPPRWAVRAAHLTALVVLPSGLWRIVLVLGHPAGYTEAGFVPFETFGSKVWMLTLSVVCELVAVLTIGLVRPWGEVVPRWIPLIGARAVRPMAAVVPAALGAAALTLIWAAVPWWWTYPHEDMTTTGILVVGVLYQPLVLWGPLTAAVTFSYYRRRRAAAAPRSTTSGSAGPTPAVRTGSGPATSG